MRCILVLGCLLFLCLTEMPQQSTYSYAQDPTKPQTSVATDSKKPHQETFDNIQAKIRQMLLDKKVPFDPDILLKRDWPERLTKVLDQMPEMQISYIREEPLAGVIMADELTLPEEVRLAGDTLILVKQLKYKTNKDHRVVLKGPYRFFIYSMKPAIAIDGGKIIMSIDNSGERGKDGKAGINGSPGKAGEHGSRGRSW
jgi:hypothetical protein